MSSDMTSGIVSENLITSGLAGRYAVALFDLAQETATLERVQQDMATLSAVLASSADLAALTLNPVFSAEEKGRAMAAVIAAAEIERLVANFVSVIVRNGRLDKLDNIIAEFNRIVAHYKGEIRASVTTARKLTKSKLAALKIKLEHMVDSDVTVESDVNEALLGGVVVKIGSRMIDSSLATRLANLEELMKEVG